LRVIGRRGQRQADRRSADAGIEQHGEDDGRHRRALHGDGEPIEGEQRAGIAAASAGQPGERCLAPPRLDGHVVGQ